jgi:hypothetical protein
MKITSRPRDTSNPTGPAPPLDLPRKFRPVSPVLDEAAIITQLAIQLSPAHSNHPTRSASTMTIIDVYDRQLPRGPFLQIVGRAVNLNEKIRQMELLMSMRLELAADQFTREQIVERLDKAIAETFQEAEEYRMGLYRDMKYVQQMAFADDAIN